jgi:hypothetical protein
MQPSYRSSKLTHVLQYAFGGNGQTLFITNITPSSHLYSETLNSLKYADRAQKIEKIQAKINVQNNVLDTVIKQKDQEIQALKKTVEDREKEIARLNEKLNKNSRKRQNQKIDNENDPNDDFISTDSENEKSEANASNIKKRLAKLMRKLHLKKSILTQKQGQKEDILNLVGDEKENSEKIFEHYLTNCDPMQQESSFTEQEKNENEAIENYENEILILKAEKENMEKEIYELKLNAKNDTLLSKEINELKISNKLKEENEEMKENELLLNKEIKDLKTENKKLSKENEKLLKENEEIRNELFTLYDDETELKNMERKEVRSDWHKRPSKICSIM